MQPGYMEAVGEPTLQDLFLVIRAPQQGRKRDGPLLGRQNRTGSAGTSLAWDQEQVGLGHPWHPHRRLAAVAILALQIIGYLLLFPLTLLLEPRQPGSICRRTL